MTISRKTLLGAATAVAVAIGTLLAAPLSATAGQTGEYTWCPPNITKLGTPVNFSIMDDHDGSGFVGTVTAGSLPVGLELKPNGTFAPMIAGIPTKVGSYQFHMRVVNGTQVGENDCTMDIVPTDSIVERIDGLTRYDVAANIAHLIAPARTAPLVYVASGENYADALSASAIAAQHNAPLLLSSSNLVPTYVWSTINRFKPANIVIVGGENALSAGVADQLARISGATVTRIGGADRFAVSRALISHPTFGATTSTTIAVATGQNFPDALSAAPVAGKMMAPVLLVDGKAGALSADEKAFLTSRGLTSATLYGGTDVLSAGIATDLTAIAGAVTRVDGFDRFAVSANTVAGNYTGPIDTVYIATGANFPDALAGGALAGITKSPILLSRKSCMTAEVAAQVTALSPKHIVLLGGPAVLDANLGTLPVCA